MLGKWLCLSSKANTFPRLQCQQWKDITCFCGNKCVPENSKAGLEEKEATVYNFEDSLDKLEPKDMEANPEAMKAITEQTGLLED